VAEVDIFADIKPKMDEQKAQPLNVETIEFGKAPSITKVPTKVVTLP